MQTSTQESDPVETEKKVREILLETDECAIDGAGSNGNLGKKERVCSPKPVVKEMERFVKEKGGVVDPNDPQKTVTSIKQLLNCNSESCVLRRADFMAFAKKVDIGDVLDKFFKPDGPSHSFDLLSNFNIDDVLAQMATGFPKRKFLHIPFQMRDFDTVGTELATTDLADELRSGYKTFGVVLNTDYSTGRGIHWFCMFGEEFADCVQLEYFNSSGNQPLPEVQAWLQKTKHHLNKELRKPVKIHETTGIRYQNDEHSCGIYCIMYIWLRLKDVSPANIKSENFNDDIMHQARKAVFRHGD